MSHIVYPMGNNSTGNNFTGNFTSPTGNFTSPTGFINTTAENYIDYTYNLQTIYSNIEQLVNNKNAEKLVVLKEELYKELTSDNEELFNEVVNEINNKDKEVIVEDIDNKDVVIDEDIVEGVKKDVGISTSKPNKVQEFRNVLQNFKDEFIELQDKFLVIDKKIKKETDKTDKDIKNLEVMINFVNNLDESYAETEEVKNINENIINLSDKIKENNSLKDAKKDYIKIRVEINDCFSIIKSINNLNTTNTCSLCMTNKVEEFIDPCGHCYCTTCKNRLIQYEGGVDMNCPICRGYIREFKPLYL